MKESSGTLNDLSNAAPNDGVARTWLVKSALAHIGQQRASFVGATRAESFSTYQNTTTRQSSDIAVLIAL